MVKNATEAKVNIVNDNESKERTRLLAEIGQRRDACSHDTVIICKSNESTNDFTRMNYSLNNCQNKTKITTKTKKQKNKKQ
jgi:hypothetical protein